MDERILLVEILIKAQYAHNASEALKRLPFAIFLPID